MENETKGENKTLKSDSFSGTFPLFCIEADFLALDAKRWVFRVAL